MTPEELLEILARASRLKTNTRHCWTEKDRKESVADHCWRSALTALLLSHEPEFSGCDMNKVIRMLLIHDLGEAFTGDIPAFVKTAEDTAEEDHILEQWISTFPEDIRNEWSGLLEEMNSLSTTEAKIYKAIDKMEAVISHNESNITTWLPLEYDLQLTYGRENVTFSPYFTELKNAVDHWTKEKIEKEGKSSS